MRWYDLFNLPKYISDLEEQVKGLPVLSQAVEELQEDYENLSREFTLYKTKFDEIEKRFLSIGEKNEIEERDDDFVDIDENYRIPIIDGVKIMQEGQTQKQAESLRIYGYDSVKPTTYASTRSRSGQRAKKTNA